MNALRRSNTSLFLILMTVAMLAGALVLRCSEATAQSAETAQKAVTIPAGNAQHGKTVYIRVGCYECHGWDGQSGGNTGSKIGPNPWPFAAFTFQLRTPINSMPPYTSKVLSDAEVADIYAFIQSLPEPPKVETIPLLR